jgi:hypothetical protein
MKIPFWLLRIFGYIRVSDYVTVEVHLSAPPIQPDLVLGKEKL